MDDRVTIREVEPQAYTAMFGLEKYLSSSGLDVALRDLIKIRASQVNGCAFCIEMHAKEARDRGEHENRIYALGAWKESPLFTDTERAVLALTDEATRIADDGVSDRTYRAAVEALGDHGVAQALMQIATINAWNRMAISTHMRHP